MISLTLLGVEPLGQSGEARDVRARARSPVCVHGGAQQIAASAAVVPAGQPLQGALKTPRPLLMSLGVTSFPLNPVSTAGRHLVVVSRILENEQPWMPRLNIWKT